MPEIIFVVGCNAAGKSTFIRTRLDELQTFEVLMTDVYKGRTKELAKQAISLGKNVLIETVFNDESFKDLVDEAKRAGYRTSIVILFLEGPQQSAERAAFRAMQQTGLTISAGNIKFNFTESFKNIASYYLYFDRSDFIYTGDDGVNKLMMSFHKMSIIFYQSNQLNYLQKFAAYGYPRGRLNEHAYQVITANEDFFLKPDSSAETQGKLNL